jgi:two-component sensor histidine kinase
LECNSRAVTKDREGNLYFGTIKGVIKYIPKLDKEIDVKPSLHITGIKLFSQETNWSEYTDKLSSWFKLPLDLTLPYHKNNISFDFVAINLYSPEKIKYQYQLSGFDNEWINSTTHTATYTNLSPGFYTFKIRAYSDNKELAEELEYNFTINKPFWKSWWFILLAGIGIVALSYLFLKIRTQRIQAANEKLEQQVALRTSEIIKQKQEIETLFKEIHHRVKNNLQVINSLINLQSSFITDEKTLAIFRECQNRIYTMAVLHEKLYSTHDLTKLELQPYVTKLTGFLNEVYQLNREVKFDIRINVNNIGIDTIIPIGLLINEVVSNSLKYAFKDNSEHIITIHINSIADKKHKMIIGDNGIGHPVDINSDQNTFGLELIKILVDQLNGKISKLETKGTVYEIFFESIDKSINKAP